MSTQGLTSPLPSHGEGTHPESARAVSSLGFIHLHCRTSYSFLSGVPNPDELFDKAKAMGFSAIAVTDRANQAACIEVSDASKKTGVRAIFGTELWMAPLVERVKLENKKKEIDRVVEFGHRIVVLAKNQQGWKNMTRLTTLAHRRMYFVPRVSFEELESMKEGLIVLSGTTSGAYATMGDLADRDTDRLARIFGKDFYFEMTDHGEPKQAEVNEKIVVASKRLGVPLVATNEVAYLEPQDVTAYDAMTAVATGHQLFSVKNTRHSITDQAYLKSEQEMLEVFPNSMVDVSMEIANQCDVVLERKKVYLPTTKPPADKETRQSQWDWLLEWLKPPGAFAGFPTDMPRLSSDIPVDELYFAWYARTGLEARFRESPEYFERAAVPDAGAPPILETNSQRKVRYRERLEWEIDQIRTMGFPTYLMIVAEFVNWAKDQGIPVGPGRGSAAGSLVVWSLRITDIDPIHFDLLFERFLNPARVSMPDIDVDFSQDQREEVIEHVKKRYGNDFVGQIAAIQTFQPKKAVRDAARLCSIPFDSQENLAKPFEDLTDDGKKIDTIDKAIENNDRLRNMYQYEPVTRSALMIAKQLEGRPRHTTVHAAGTVITSRRLDETVGLFSDAETGRSVIGIDMGGAEDLGLVKFDFLGLKTLDVIDYTCKLIKRRTGVIVDPVKFPLHDTNVLELLARSDTKGVFQIESDGMRKLVQGLIPSSIEDVIAALALYRPGPLKSGMVQDFVDRKHGKKKVVHLHEKLAKVLDRTYGVIVYQEQVMQIAQVLSNYSLAEADLLRRAMGKKKPEEMAKQKKSFVEGAEKNNVSSKDAVSIFDLVDYFSGYGFNRSHSAAYGLITWQTAYLKTYHRAEFMAAAMSWEKSGSTDVAEMIIDVLSHGTKLLGPDIEESGPHFDVVTVDDKPVIRFGIGSLKGIGGAAKAKILEEREKSGPFGSLEEFLRRRDPRVVNKRICETLSESGAFDRYGVSRWKVRELLTKKVGKKKVVEAPRTQQDMVEFRKKYRMEPPWPHSERLRLEQRALGFWVTGHPLDRYSEISMLLPSATSRSLRMTKWGEPVTLACVTLEAVRKRTRDRKYVTFATFSDREGTFKAFAFHEVGERFKTAIDLREPVLVRGIYERGVVRIEEVTLLSELRRKMARMVQVRVKESNASEEQILKMLEILEKHAGEVPVRLKGVTALGKNAGLVMADMKVNPTEDLFVELELWAGDPLVGQILAKTSR